MSESEFSESVSRKRGRPRGKNRVPLTQEERKARNARYEKQRRGAYSNALNHLATVLECPDSMSGDDVITTAISFIKKNSNTNNRESLEFLRHVDGLLNYQIEKLCPQLGVNVDEIDNLEISILEANTNEIPEDFLVGAYANIIPKIAFPSTNAASERDENKDDESAQVMRTHNKKRGKKRRKLDASYNQAWSSRELAPSQSGVSPTVSNTNYSDTAGRPSSSSHGWSLNIEPLTPYPSTTSSERLMCPSRDRSSSLSSTEYHPPVPGCCKGSTISVQWMNSNATSTRFPRMSTSSTLSNERMTSSQGAVSLSVRETIPDSSNLSGISVPVGNLTASAHYAKHGYSNVSFSQPQIWPLQSVQPFTLETALSEFSTFEVPSPEAILPDVSPHDDDSHETTNAFSSQSLMDETLSPDAVASNTYYQNVPSCGTTSYDTSSHDTASCDSASVECVIPESIMPLLLAHFPDWPTPESMPSTSPAKIQAVTQLQQQNQSLQSLPQPGQQPYYSAPQISFNNAFASSQSAFPDLENLSESVELPWPQLSQETDQMANNYIGQNEGFAESFSEEFFTNL